MMLRKLLATVVATVTAISIMVLPVSASEPGYVEVGDAAHGFVTIPADWWQDTETQYYVNGAVIDQLVWIDPSNTQSISLIREPQDTSLLPETVLFDRMTWIADQWEQDPATYTNTYMQMVEPISGCEAFFVMYSFSADQTGGAPINYATYYFVDDNYIYQVESSAWNGGDYLQAFAAADTFHF